MSKWGKILTKIAISVEVLVSLAPRRDTVKFYSFVSDLIRSCEHIQFNILVSSLILDINHKVISCYMFQVCLFKVQ